MCVLSRIMSVFQGTLREMSPGSLHVYCNVSLLQNKIVRDRIMSKQYLELCHYMYKNSSQKLSYNFIMI